MVDEVLLWKKWTDDILILNLIRMDQEQYHELGNKPTYMFFDQLSIFEYNKFLVW